MAESGGDNKYTVWAKIVEVVGRPVVAVVVLVVVGIVGLPLWATGALTADEPEARTATGTASVPSLTHTTPATRIEEAGEQDIILSPAPNTTQPGRFPSTVRRPEGSPSPGQHYWLLVTTPDGTIFPQRPELTTVRQTIDVRVGPVPTYALIVAAVESDGHSRLQAWLSMSGAQRPRLTLADVGGVELDRVDLTHG